jgi:hypothetical protein
MIKSIKFDAGKLQNHNQAIYYSEAAIPKVVFSRISTTASNEILESYPREHPERVERQQEWQLVMYEQNMAGNLKTAKISLDSRVDNPAVKTYIGTGPWQSILFLIPRSFHDGALLTTVQRPAPIVKGQH